MATQYGIDLDTHEEDQKQLKALQDKHAALANQKRVLQGAIEATSKKFEGMLADKKKEFQQAEYAKARIVMNYNERITLLRAKGREIQELIERVRVTGGADKDLQAILTKWEDANLKMFEKHPADKPSDLAILDEADVQL